MNGPDSFKGRKVGVLVTDGVDAELVAALQAALDDEGALHEIIAPHVGGVEASDGVWIAAKQKIDGAPSVLYDAVALIASAEGAAKLARLPAARDFVSDAFAHCKFIAYSTEALSIFQKAGVSEDMDEGCIELESEDDAQSFVTACRQLRHWDREAKLAPED